MTLPGAPWIISHQETSFQTVLCSKYADNEPPGIRLPKVLVQGDEVSLSFHAHLLQYPTPWAVSSPTLLVWQAKAGHLGERRPSFLIQQNHGLGIEVKRWFISVTRKRGPLFVPPTRLVYTQNNHTETVFIKILLGPLALVSYWLILTSWLTHFY